MLKCWTSYFYQVRNFPTNMIPLSTAVWDPSWYHRSRGNSYVYRDKRGIINGLRISPLMPGKELDGLCHGVKGCDSRPWMCQFLKGYREQLDKIGFNYFMSRLEEYVSRLQELGWIDVPNPEVAFLFHETPTNICSERIEVTDWFDRNGYPIEEWNYGSIQNDVDVVVTRRNEVWDIDGPE